MKRTKLLVRHKQDLIRYIIKACDPVPERDAVRIAYEIANAAAGAVIKQEQAMLNGMLDIFPKYTGSRKEARVATSICTSNPRLTTPVKRFVSTHELNTWFTTYDEFNGKNMDLSLMVFCSSNIYFWDLVEDYTRAEEKYEDKKEKLIEDYTSLIWSCKYLDELVDVWPEAAQVVTPSPGCTAMVHVSPDALERIRADMKTRIEL